MVEARYSTRPYNDLLRAIIHWVACYNYHIKVSVRMLLHTYDPVCRRLSDLYISAMDEKSTDETLKIVEYKNKVQDFSSK